MKITPRQVQLALAGVGAFVGVLLLSRRASKEPAEGNGGGWGPFEPGPSKPPVDPYAVADLTPKGVRDLTNKPGVVAFRAWARERWGENPKAVNAKGQPLINISADKDGEHGEGRAWDLMTLSKEHGDKIVEALLAPEGDEPDALARRAGLMYLIWQGRTWHAYPFAGQGNGNWTKYNGANQHLDHIHFSFSWDGANARTSLYSMIEPTTIA